MSVSVFSFGNDFLDDTTTDAGLFLPPLTSETGLPSTLVRGPWTSKLNSIRTTIVVPPTTIPEIPAASPTVTSFQSSTTDIPMTVTSATQATSPPAVGTRASNPTAQFWYLAAGLGGAALVALAIWYVQRRRSRRRKEALHHGARTRFPQYPDSFGGQFNDFRSDITPHRDIGPSAERPMPVQGNFRGQRGMAQRDPKVRWTGLPATSSRPSVANPSAPGAAGDSSTIGGDDFFDNSISDEGRMNPAYRKYRSKARNQKHQQGHVDEPTVSDDIDYDASQLFLDPGSTSEVPTVRVSIASEPDGSPPHRPSTAHLRPERRSRRSQFRGVRFRSRSPTATTRNGPTLLTPQVHYQHEHGGHSQEASLVGDDTTGFPFPDSSGSKFNMTNSSNPMESYADTSFDMEFSEDFLGDAERNRRMTRQSSTFE
ncbi:MAG: hypothetical protein M1840_005723 [Geoglossum simile]|nr:MAG: hypothetical protein M1840_005723 [Geoglossum simile]